MDLSGGRTIMISALEIGFALFAPLLVLACVMSRPRPVPVRIRAGTRRRPRA
jgi:hypothetical protein